MQRLGARDVFYALAAHGLLFALLAVSFQFGSVTDQAPPGTEKAVQAVAIEESVERNQPETTDDDTESVAQAKEQAEREAEEQARREAEEQARREAEAAEQARREAEEQAQREAEEQARREAEEQARREAEAAEQARREAEEQARREAEEQARREAEEQARREAEAAERARREAEEQARREAEEQARREAEAAEQARRLEEARGTFDGAIRQKIERAWTRPASVPSGLSCVVAVRLGPGGSVLSAQVVQSSGNSAFDQSAERAVFRADPLPMPDEAALAAPYRQGVELVFNPDD